jgi:ABC-type ATPase involved in cell division
MDDTMKGLDADTSSKCFKALLGVNGLLRKEGFTVIMATHNGKFKERKRKNPNLLMCGFVLMLA